MIANSNTFFFALKQQNPKQLGFPQDLKKLVFEPRAIRTNFYDPVFKPQT